MSLSALRQSNAAQYSAWPAARGEGGDNSGRARCVSHWTLRHGQRQCPVSCGVTCRAGAAGSAARLRSASEFILFCAVIVSTAET